MARTEEPTKLAEAVAWFKGQIPDRVKASIAPFRRQLLEARLQARIMRGGERLKPNFLIAGAMKAGTTSLFEYMSRHPQFVAPLVKEIQYFSWNGYKSLDWYWAHFPLVSEVQPGQVSGEASPGYIFHPQVPERVTSVLPDAKLIMLLRDPVSRAISHYHHAFRHGFDKRPIEQALRSEKSLAVPRIDPTSDSFVRVMSKDYVSRGFYADQLQRWFDYFDRERFLIMSSEEFFADPAAGYAKVLDFLNLEPIQLSGMRPHNAGSYSRDLSPELLRFLADCYVEPNRRLYELLGTDFGWGRELAGAA